MMTTTECITDDQNASTTSSYKEFANSSDTSSPRSRRKKDRSSKNRKKSTSTDQGMTHPELLFGHDSSSSSASRYSMCAVDEDFVLDVSSSSWNMLDLEDMVSVESFMLPTRMSPTKTTKRKTVTVNAPKCCNSNGEDAALHCMSPPPLSTVSLDDDCTTVTSPTVSTNESDDSTLHVEEEEPEQGRPEMKLHSSFSSILLNRHLLRNRRPRRVYYGGGKSSEPQYNCKSSSPTSPRRAKSLGNILSLATKIQCKNNNRHHEEEGERYIETPNRQNFNWNQQTEQQQQRRLRSPTSNKMTIRRYGRGGTEVVHQYSPI